MYSRARRLVIRTLTLAVAGALAAVSSAAAFFGHNAGTEVAAVPAEAPAIISEAEEPAFFALYADGKELLRAESEEMILSALESLKESYMTDGTISADISGEIEISEAKGGTPVSEAEIPAILRAGLTVVTLSEGYEEVPEEYKTVYEYDPEGFSDEVETLQAGSDGLIYRRLLFTYENGELAGVSETESGYLVETRNEVILVGAQEGSRYDSRGYFIWPVDGTITSRFGKRSVTVGTSNHQALDIACPKGTEIKAADSGTVVMSSWEGTYGNFIKLRHDDGSFTCYAHMSKRLVSVGDRVAQGDIIGLVGTTGVSSGPHLHFEVRTAENIKVDPENYLPEKD